MIFYVLHSDIKEVNIELKKEIKYFYIITQFCLQFDGWSGYLLLID
jgi:hypothetical protein